MEVFTQNILKISYLIQQTVDYIHSEYKIPFFPKYIISNINNTSYLLIILCLHYAWISKIMAFIIKYKLPFPFSFTLLRLTEK